MLVNADIKPDRDGDGFGDETQDNCGGTFNPDQNDADGDSLGDVVRSRADRDGDGFPNATDVCPTVAGPANGCPAPPATPAPPRVNTPAIVRFATPLVGTTIGPSQLIELEVFDDFGTPTVTVFDDDGTVCALSGPPYSCTWHPTGADVGRATLLASAVDADRRSSLGSVRVRVAKFEADLTSKRRGRKVTGRLVLPQAVEKALGCQGEVTVRRKKVRRTVKLKRNCTFSVRLPPGKGKPKARFAGNSVVEPATYTEVRHERAPHLRRRRRRRPARGRLSARRVDGAGELSGDQARQAGAGRGPGRARQDRARQGARQLSRPEAPAPPVLRGPRRSEGAVRVDDRKQLLRIQADAAGTGWAAVQDDIFGQEFLFSRPPPQAIAAPEPVVLLIDEIEKTDQESRRCCSSCSGLPDLDPELGRIEARTHPVVLLTSNNTRELTEALKRRCLYLWLDYPATEHELQIVRLHAPELSETVARKLVDVVHQVRQLDLKKPPSIAESIDWARALLLLGADDISQAVFRDTMSIIVKHRTDLDTVAERVGVRLVA